MSATSQDRRSPADAVKQAAAGPARGLASLRDTVRARRGGELTWRVGVGVLGAAIVVAGIVLLPLPGPGWLIIFAGLGVLATEFEWAGRLLGYARTQVGRWTAWVQRRPLWVRGALGLLTGVIVIAAVVLAWRWYGG